MELYNINSQMSAAFDQKETADNSKLGQQEFLQLLIAQMRNQDPINPLDGAEFASQLAQFNSVEQLISVNDGLKQLQESQELMSSSLTNSMAASLTGKNVKALSNQIYLGSGESADIHFKLNNPASNVEIIIRSANGSEIRRETLQGVSSGDNSWNWDGRNNAGDRMSDGEYIVEVQASNEGSRVDSLVFVEGIANKVRYTGSGVYLSINNIQVPIGDVEEVGTGNF